MDTLRGHPLYRGRQGLQQRGDGSLFYQAGEPRPDISVRYKDFDDSWDEWSPRVGVQYQFNDDVMIFASYTEGFKSGGFFGRQANFTDVDAQYEPEYVESYELGMKSTWMDGRMIFNPTIFYNNYDDKQESVLIPINLSNVATVVRNASTLEIFGIEAEVQFQVTEEWNLRASYGYLDAEYDDFFADLNGDGRDHGQLRSHPAEYTRALLWRGIELRDAAGPGRTELPGLLPVAR